ncbi:hypothetical protein GCM10010174_56010 [Kutzneria viridogrisea]|uniref:Biotin carboxylase n=1 Tax=Kutzneria viridogrisea TaxID=47990 RepID=A0ABR6BKT4_9PSEU|nr:biotin carboxylase [Kutzneria viridogrisea]
MKRIAIIGSRTAMARHAKEFGLEIVLVHSPEAPPTRVAQYLDQAICCPVTDPEAVYEVLRPLHEERPFSRVLAPGEDGVLAAAVASERFGLEGNSVQTVLTIKNKVLTRKVLDELGTPVRSREVASEAELVEFLTEIGDQVILKPIDSTGSLATHIVRDRQQAATCWALFAQEGHHRGLVEEYLVGPEVTMESFTVAGQHFPVGVDEYIKNDTGLVPLASVVPGRISAEDREAMRQQMVALLDAVGLREGPAHTEFILTANGPRILETHSRIGGGGIDELVRRAHGVDLSRVQVTVPLGLEEFTPPDLDAGRGAVMIFFAPKPGRVTAVSGLEELGVTYSHTPVEPAWTGLKGLEHIRQAEVGVNLCLQVGDIAPEVNTNWDRLMGCVVATGESAQDALDRAEQVMAAIKIETEPVG